MTLEIKIYCDICKKLADDNDFAFNAMLVEIRTSLTGESLTAKNEKVKKEFQICKGCFYSHISKLLKNGK